MADWQVLMVGTDLVIRFWIGKSFDYMPILTKSASLIKSASLTKYSY